MTIESSLQLILFLGHFVVTFFPKTHFHLFRELEAKRKMYVHRTLEGGKRGNYHRGKVQSENAQLVVAFRFSSRSANQRRGRKKETVLRKIRGKKGTRKLQLSRRRL